MLMSPSIARLADTPPVVGSVMTEMKGSRASDRRLSAALVFAICSSEYSASCMRAPPLAAKHTSGIRCSRQCSTARTNFSPTTDHIQAGQFSRHHDQRVAFAGLLLGLGEPVLVALRILEFERVLRLNLGGKLGGGSGIEKLREPLAAVDPHMVAALRAYVQIALDLRAIQNGIAGGALGPQAFRHRARATLGFDTRRDNSLEPGHALV